jgi:glycyl-tRNA synthetase beta chain
MSITRDNQNNLLVELFVEELPPKALKKLGEAFASVLSESLKTQGLVTEASTVTNFASPRRLAAHITDVVNKADDKQVTQKLMPASVGLDANGNATPALLKRLQGLGADESAVKKLRQESDGKAEVLFYDVMQTGATLQEGLQKALDESLAKLPIPKVMTYQLADGWTNVNFVRPAHSLIALFGSDVVPITALGLTAGNTTQGHRFESKNLNIAIKHADTYTDQLKLEGAVIASFAERRAEIEAQLNAAADKQNLKPIADDALLDEVTALVERPNVLLGQFEEIYLEVPQECLILTMKANQKYFPLLDGHGKLTNKFLIVSNIKPIDPSAVIGGNERVVRPRLADAKFFFDQDRKKTLESRLEGLEKVVYHNKLGSQGERNTRVVAIAKAIATHLGDDHLVSKVELAAKLSKADLITDMVGEFPELQGIMGRYYAQNEGLDHDVAYAIEDHYKPRFAGDELPRSQVGIVVTLADKLETLVGLFSIGEKPTGDKDPFGLRRHALGVIRMLIEKDLSFGVLQLIKIGEKPFPNLSSVQDSLSEFIFDRFAGVLREDGYNALEIDAVFQLKGEHLSLKDMIKRLEAVRAFSTLVEAPALAAANKRVGNILKKVEGEVKAQVNDALLQESAEKSLATAIAKVKPEADKLFESGDYTNSLKALAALKSPVDDFFDHVMVNAEDPQLKANRLGLLATLHQAMNRVADLSKLAS